MLAWPSAVWGAGVLAGNAPPAKGKWAMAPLPQWSAGENVTGFWGGSSTAVDRRPPSSRPQAAKFATWLNTDPEALTGAGRERPLPGRHGRPDLRRARRGARRTSPASPTSTQPAAEIAQTARGFTLGPNVNVTYSAFKDAFAEGGQGQGRRSRARPRKMQEATVADMKKQGFQVAGG